MAGRTLAVTERRETKTMEKIVRNLSILAAVAAILGIISAYGSTCPTLDPPSDPTSKLHIMYTLQPVFIATTTITWIVGFAWIILTWAFITQKTWSYFTAVLVSLFGALGGFIPAILVMTNGMPFSPSLMRAFLNLFILIYLVLPSKAPTIKAALTTPGIVSSGATTSILTYILVAVGIVVMVQPFAIGWTHIIDGVNEYGLEAVQFFGGLFSILLGASMKLSERLHSTRMLALSKTSRISIDDQATQ